jgi:3-hexulose-6-phosphate synthase
MPKERPPAHPASERVKQRMLGSFTFQFSVDVDNLPTGLKVAEAAVAAGIDIVELGTPLIKAEGLRNAMPAFRARFPDALLLADMKTMDGGTGEANMVFAKGGNIIDFLAASGEPTAHRICAVRDKFRAADPDVPRLVFADIGLPHHGPAARAIEMAEAMIAVGVDGIGIHLQLDARRDDPSLWHSGYLGDVARALLPVTRGRVPLQVVGGLSVAQARDLAQDGFCAFVVSGNVGVHDLEPRLNLPPDEIRALTEKFITEVPGKAAIEG